MLRLESRILKREYKVYEGNLYASQIRNTLSGMDFIPDGNSVEFLFHFTDGSEFTSKGLQVKSSENKNTKLIFTFEECDGITVTMTLWAGEDGNTLKKQISFVQNNAKIIDYILLEHVGIINSKTHFCVPRNVSGGQLSGYHSSLGQPFYIDSLFFGCEFPATQNTIVYGIGQVKYFLGKNIDGVFKCPVTVVGGAVSNTMIDVQKAFFEYIDDIAQPNNIRIQYNSWYDHMLNIDEQNIKSSFTEIEKNLTAYGVAPLDAYVVDDGWNDYRAPFWKFNKKFPTQLGDISELTKGFSSSLGLWFGPRGGYSNQMRFAKRMEKNGFGAYNSQSNDICVGDEGYLKNVKQFLLSTVERLDLSYLKLDGFCLSPCTNPKHSHATGGKKNMYFITEMWQGWIDIFTAIRNERAKSGKKIWLNLTCYVNPSPWWLQYANSIWLQNSDDLGFADNLEEQSQLEREITYRDARYYDALCTRAYQLQNKYFYNHEPIYANQAKVNYTDEQFEKYLYFNACRGQALNELHISSNMMNKAKWMTLAQVINWQRENYDILKNSMLLGGNPEENNVYGYFCWNDNGNGIIALRNPTNEDAPLTLTLNKLMGCPESLSDVKCTSVYNTNINESFDSYSYNDKIDLTLKPFEVKVLQFK